MIYRYSWIFHDGIELQDIIKSNRAEQIMQIANFFEQRLDLESSQNEFHDRLNKYMDIADQQFSIRSFR